MSDRRGDEGGPLFPRRTLSGPAAAQQTQPAGSDRTTSRSDSRGGRDAGPPTAAMPRVDERARHGDTQGRTPAVTQQPSVAGREQPWAQAATPEQPRKRPQQARRARLQIVRLDPWSVMKMSFALSIALAIVTVVAVAIVWSVLDAAGVWESVNTAADTLTNPDAGDEFDVQRFVGLDRVMGLTMVVSLANVVLLTALATLGAFIYNLAAALLGGFEVTLAEDR